MTQVVLHGVPQSTYVRSARICCLEAGVAHELRVPGSGSVESVLEELRSDAYRCLHPFARMPVLQDGDVVVFETSAIGRYLSDSYGQGCLVPADPREAIRMEQWVSAANCYVIPDTAQKFLFPLIFQEEPDMAAIEEAKPLLRAHYETLDKALEGRRYLAGDSVSLADILLAPLLHTVGGLPGGMPLFDNLQNLGRWWEAVSARPSFVETAPPMPGESEAAA